VYNPSTRKWTRSSREKSGEEWAEGLICALQEGLCNVDESMTDEISWGGVLVGGMYHLLLHNLSSTLGEVRSSPSRRISRV
jgi:hypothetical protein